MNGLDTLQRSRQNLQHYRNCVSTQPNVKTSHFETTVTDRFLECVLPNWLFATYTDSCLIFIFNFFVEIFLSVFWQKIFHIFISF